MILSGEDYYRLMAAMRHADVVRLEAQIAVARVEATKRQVFDAMVAKYGLDPTAEYRFDDATQSLTVEGAK